MAVTRVIDWWQHNFKLGTATVHVVITDDVEGTVSAREYTYADSALPATMKTWEQGVAASRNATLATPNL